MFKDTYELLKNRGIVDKSTTVKMILEFLKSESKYFNYSAIRINGVRSKNINSTYNLNLFFEPKKTNTLN